MTAAERGSSPSGPEAGDAFRERRSVVRLPQRLPVECTRQQEVFKAVLVDIGAGGALLETLEPVAVGDVVTLGCILQAGSDVVCTVRWTRDLPSGNHVAGLVFVDAEEDAGESWARRLLARLGMVSGASRQRRRTFRISTWLGGELRLSHGGLPMTVTVEDLGVGGGTVRGIASLPANTIVFFSVGPVNGLEALTVKARVLVCGRDRVSQETIHHLGFVDLETTQEQLLCQYMQFIMRGEAGVPDPGAGEGMA